MCSVWVRDKPVAENETGASMAERVVLVSLFLLAVVCRGFSQQTTAELTPGSFNAYLSQTINFSCVVTEANGILWFLNDSTFTAVDNDFMRFGIIQLPVIRNGATFQSDISVTATETLHKLTLQCLAIPVDIAPQVLSNVSTLLVQGLLSSPENLNIIKEDSAHLRLSWGSPPTLDLTTIDPDISGYQVCTNVTSLCWVIEETGFSVPRLAVPVEWSISALNVVGEGSPTAIQQQPCSLGASFPLPSQDDVTIEISFLSGLRLKLELHFPVEEDCFPLYQLNCTLQSSGSQTSHGPALPSVISGGTTSVTVTLELELEFLFNERYSVLLSVSGGTADLVLMNFTTYDVQRVNVVSEPGAIEVTCFFASGSQAQGCHVTIDGDDVIVSEDVIRSGDADSAVHRQSQLDVGLYLVTVYDIESDGSIALDNPVVARSVSVSQPAPSVTPTPLNNTNNTTISAQTPSPQPPQNDTTLDTIIGAVFGSLVAVIAAVSLILILTVWIRHKARHSSEIVLQSNQVYDVVKQQQQSGRAVQLEPCSAYGVHLKDDNVDLEYETVS